MRHASDPEGLMPPRQMLFKPGSAAPTPGWPTSGTLSGHGRAPPPAGGRSPVQNALIPPSRGMGREPLPFGNVPIVPLGGPILTQLGQGFIKALLQSKFAAEDRGASEEVLAR
ncbi:hypothetical protein CC86DRAFT_412332 [Ophiobolus disseminans]|uniref:Uncharacterized protein n=1 Tax=Ophiobolus disseminans TaxID=1469910 RepID=A0A6A6ZFG3_9PLEO|nr:hypothetical protein CC86DRAFT_412332 [Ophiobolus disseminans]